MQRKAQLSIQDQLNLLIQQLNIKNPTKFEKEELIELIEQFNVRRISLVEHKEFMAILKTKNDEARLSLLNSLRHYPTVGGNGQIDRLTLLVQNAENSYTLAILMAECEKLYIGFEFIKPYVLANIDDAHNFASVVFALSKNMVKLDKPLLDKIAKNKNNLYLSGAIKCFTEADYDVLPFLDDLIESGVEASNFAGEVCYFKKHDELEQYLPWLSDNSANANSIGNGFRLLEAEKILTTLSAKFLALNPSRAEDNAKQLVRLHKADLLTDAFIILICPKQKILKTKDSEARVYPEHSHARKVERLIDAAIQFKQNGIDNCHFYLFADAYDEINNSVGGFETKLKNIIDLQKNDLLNDYTICILLKFDKEDKLIPQLKRMQNAGIKDIYHLEVILESESKNYIQIIDDFIRLKEAGIDDRECQAECARPGMADALLKFKMVQIDHQPWIEPLKTVRNPAITADAIIELILAKLDKDLRNVYAVIGAKNPGKVTEDLISLEEAGILGDGNRDFIINMDKNHEKSNLSWNEPLIALSKANIVGEWREFALCNFEKEPYVIQTVVQLKKAGILDKIKIQDYQFADLFLSLHENGAFNESTYKEVIDFVKSYYRVDPIELRSKLDSFVDAMIILSKAGCYAKYLPFLKRSLDISRMNYPFVATAMVTLAPAGDLSDADAAFLLDRPFNDYSYSCALALVALRKLGVTEVDSRAYVDKLKGSINHFVPALEKLSQAGLQINFDDLIAKINNNFHIKCINETTVIFEKNKNSIFYTSEITKVAVNYPKVSESAAALPAVEIKQGLSISV